MTFEKQETAAVNLVNALSRNKNGLDVEARAAMMRLAGGHERRTPALISMIEAHVNRCAGVKRQPETGKFWLRWWKKGTGEGK